MGVTGGDTMATAREIGNLRFLIEHQLKLIDAMGRGGDDPSAALDLLRRLLRRDEDLRGRMRSEPVAERLQIA